MTFDSWFETAKAGKKIRILTLTKFRQGLKFVWNNVHRPKHACTNVNSVEAEVFREK